MAVTDGMLHFELSLAYEVFGADLSHLVTPWYELVLCGPAPVTVDRFRLEPDDGLDRLTHAATVIVPGWADVDEDPPADLVAAVRAAHEAGARIASLCTGAFVLAAAGLLDGRRATTHWAHTDVLAARFPRVEVDPDVLYVDNGSVLTSAGKAAAMDLCLHLVRLDHGSSAANAVARRLVVPPHRSGGQAQFVPAPVPTRSDHPLTDLFPWALERLDHTLTVEDLARRANMSSRTLTRHFRAATGTTPSSGSSPNASAAPRNSWKPPRTASTPSPPPPVWAPPPPSAATSTAPSASPRTPTAAPSTPPAPTPADGRRPRERSTPVNHRPLGVGGPGAGRGRPHLTTPRGGQRRRWARTASLAQVILPCAALGLPGVLVPGAPALRVRAVRAARARDRARTTAGYSHLRRTERNRRPVTPAPRNRSRRSSRRAPAYVLHTVRRAGRRSGCAAATFCTSVRRPGTSRSSPAAALAMVSRTAS